MHLACGGPFGEPKNARGVVPSRSGSHAASGDVAGEPFADAVSHPRGSAEGAGADTTGGAAESAGALALHEDSRGASPGGDWSSVRLVSACTLCSRVLGLVRDAAMAAVFGNGAVLDAFTVAFRIPNLARRLFGEGALTAAFLPRFIRLRRDAGEAVGWAFAVAVLRLLLAFLGTATVAVTGALVVVLKLTDLRADSRLLLELTAMMLPYVVLVCFVAVVSAVLHSFGRFVLPAAMPIVLNLGWLAALAVAVTFAAPRERIYVVAWGIVAAGVVQMTLAAWALPGVGFRWRVDGVSVRSEIRSLVRSLLPLLAGLSVVQVNALVDSLLAWGLARPEAVERVATVATWRYPLEAGTASALYFAQRLYQFPLGVFGVALGTVVFPRLARCAVEGRRHEFSETLRSGLRQVLAVGIPASVGLVLVADDVTVALFQRGAFDAADARQTAGVLAMYSLSVWATCGLMVVHRAFYALEDQSTPLRAGMLCVVLNLGLNVAFVWPLGEQGLALATTLATVAQLALVTVWATGRFGAVVDSGTWWLLVRVALATASMAGACLLLRRIVPFGSAGGVAARLGLIVAGGAIVYYAAARRLGVRELDDLLRR